MTTNEDDVTQPEAQTAIGTFVISMTPADHELTGTEGYLTFTKEWTGGFEGRSAGTFLSAGDPSAGMAGYVAIELMDGTLNGGRGTFSLLQLGTMVAGEADLRYVIAPGSGSGDLAGITGVLDLDAEDGLHKYTLTYALP